jgi:capsular polysaccharide transport system permease protein
MTMAEPDQISLPADGINKAIPRNAVAHFLHELREGGRKQANVVFALIFRDIRTRSKEDDLGLLYLVGIVLEPAIGVFAVATFWYVMRVQEIMGVHTFLFVAVSMTAFSIIRRSISSIPRSIRSTVKFYAFPNIKPFDALLASFILETSLIAIGGLLVFFVLWWFAGLKMDLRDPLEAIGIVSLIMCSGFGLSLALGTYGAIYSFLPRIVGSFTRVLFFTSAVIHPAAELPPVAQQWLAYNPFAHAMELLRYHTLSIPPFAEASVSFLRFFAAACFFFGFLAYYANRHRIIER